MRLEAVLKIFKSRFQDGAGLRFGDFSLKFDKIMLRLIGYPSSEIFLKQLLRLHIIVSLSYCMVFGSAKFFLNFESYCKVSMPYDKEALTL